MPTFTGTLTGDGALVNVAVGVAEARRQLLQRLNLPVPAPSKVCALLDPGSHVTLVDEQALPQLGITSYVQLPLLSSASGLVVNWLPVYYLSVTLLDNADRPLMYWPQVDVYGTTYQTNSMERAVFGRDLLADCVFHYDGKAGSFSLTV